MRRRNVALILVLLAAALLFATRDSNGVRSQTREQVTEWNQFSGGSAHNGYSSFSGPTAPNLTWTYNLTGSNFGLVSSNHLLLAAGVAPAGGLRELSESNGTVVNTLSTSYGGGFGPTTTYPAAVAGVAYFEESYYNYGTSYVVQADYLSNGGVAYDTIDVPGTTSSPRFGQGLVSYDSSVLLIAPFATNQLLAFIGGLTTPSWRGNLTGKIDTIPTVGNGTALVGYADLRSVSGFSLTSGVNEWNVSLDSNLVTPAAFYNDAFYFGTIGGFVYSISNQGQVVWSQGLGVSIESTPTVSEGLLYVGSDNGTLFALNVSNPSSEAWSYNVGGEIIAPPAVSNNNLVYVGTTTGYLYALNSSTGSLVWKYNTHSSITSSLVLDNGYLFAVTTDGQILAFAPSTTYDVTFTESGLPSGLAWWVDLNGDNQSSTSNTIDFSLPNGTYAYSTGASGYNASVSTGSVTVNGANLSNQETFTVIPEFPLPIALPLLVMATLLAVALRKKTPSKLATTEERVWLFLN